MSWASQRTPVATPDETIIASAPSKGSDNSSLPSPSLSSPQKLPTPAETSSSSEGDASAAKEPLSEHLRHTDGPSSLTSSQPLVLKRPWIIDLCSDESDAEPATPKVSSGLSQGKPAKRVRADDAFNSDPAHTEAGVFTLGKCGSFFSQHKVRQSAYSGSSWC